MADSGRVDLSWMPETSAKEWQLELDALKQLRILLAGAGFRITARLGDAAARAAVADDVSLLQSFLQQQIERVQEVVSVSKELAAACGAQSGEGADPDGATETVH